MFFLRNVNVKLFSSAVHRFADLDFSDRCVFVKFVLTCTKTMDFSPGHIYHVYNRGNNSQTVFFTLHSRELPVFSRKATEIPSSSC